MFFRLIKRIMSLLFAAALMLFCSISSFAVIMGDADGDETVTAADARLILRASVNLAQEKPYNNKAADMNGDGYITVSDARLALRCAVGLSASSIKGAVVTGYTSKGYEIYKINGITYIDGIIIVNKSYSLPASYAPGGLKNECEAAFREMCADAKKQGLTIYNASGYRSYGTQSAIYRRYVQKDGVAAADRYSARPGFSEHQTGLAIDLNSITRDFAYTKEGKWVVENCSSYGFIIRYPLYKESITGYMYEPWHIRYVGISHADKIKASGLTVEEYYGIKSVY